MMRKWWSVFVVAVVAGGCGRGGAAAEPGESCAEVGEQICGSGEVLVCRRDPNIARSVARAPNVGPTEQRYELLEACGFDERCVDGACVENDTDDDDDI